MRYLVALLVALSLSGPAAAHDWYPAECCGGEDCGPVLRTEMVAGAAYYSAMGIGHASVPIMIVTTKDGAAPVDPSLPRRVSKDNRMHACLRKIHEGFGQVRLEVRCIFDPPTN